MKTGLSASLCLIVCFLVCSSEAQTIITAELGQDVILPCKVPNNTNILITAVEWNRPDQDPEYVLFYRDGHFVPEYQHPSYQNRVDLQDKDMKDGDFSLILKNVMKNDTGTYKCQVYQRSKFEQINTINLVVHLPGNKEEISGDGGEKDGGEKDGGDKDGVIVGPVVIMILLLAVAVLGSVGFLIYRRYRRQNSKLPGPTDEAAAEQMLQNKDMKLFLHQKQPQLV